MTDRFERFSFAITEIYRSWHRIASTVMAEYGLKGSCAVYFAAMNRYKEGITAVQLGELCSRNKSDVSRVLAQMIEKGLVQKVNIGTNVYRAKMFLTADGQEIADRIDKLAQKAVDLGSFGITDNQRDAFYEALETIASNLHAVTTDEIANS